MNADEIKFASLSDYNAEWLLCGSRLYRLVEGRWYETEHDPITGQYVLTKESQKRLALARHKVQAFLIVGATLMGCLLAVLLYSMR